MGFALAIVFAVFLLVVVFLGSFSAERFSGLADLAGDRGFAGEAG